MGVLSKTLAKMKELVLLIFASVFLTLLDAKSKKREKKQFSFYGDPRIVPVVAPYSLPFPSLQLSTIDSPVQKSPIEVAARDLIPSDEEAAYFPTTYQIGSCNDIENLINDERKRYGYKPLKCDLHSWFGEHACCYTRDHNNGGCVWNKPYELSKWDKREGYEISHATSGQVSAKGAFNGWKRSPGHYALIRPSNGYWKDLDTVGCWWEKHFANCWFATEEPFSAAHWSPDK